jgi:hypothetical protein
MASLKIKDIPQYRIPASSLLETVVASMVMMLVFGVGMMTYMNVVRSNTSLSDLQAAQQLDEVFYDTQKNKKYMDEQQVSSRLIITKRVTPYKNSDVLYCIYLQAEDPSGRILAKRTDIVRTEDED